MRAIVTGGMGFVGSNLVDHLINAGHEVAIIDNLATSGDYFNSKANFFCRDIRKLTDDAIDELDYPCDVIFHLAALARIQPSFSRPHETLSVNAQGTVRVLEMARRLNAKVVYAGSSSFYADPHKNPYAHSKWIGEEHCKMYSQVYNLSTVIARFFNVYGKRHVRDGDNACMLGIFEKQKIDGLPITVTGNGEQRRDFTNVDDICEGLIAMSKDHWKGQIFNLGRSYNYSINEVARMFSPDSIKYIPARPGEAWETLADISETTAKLGWIPKRNLPDYVRSFMESLDEAKRILE